MTKALSLTGVFNEIGYEPHAVQRRIHKQMNAKRFRAVCAGRRTGKSTLGGHELVPRAFEAFFAKDVEKLSKTGKRHEFWIIGPEYSDAEKEFRVLWNDLEQLEMPFDRPGSYNDVNSGNMHISLWDGIFQVHAKSAKYPQTLIGEALKGVILAEAAKLKPSVWTKYIRPTLADYRGWALLTSTPEGKNWFYEQWQMGQRHEEDWWSIRMPSWTNDILFPLGRFDPEIRSMERGMTEEKFNQEIGADFSENVGAVFKDFDEEINVRHIRYDPTLPLYLATDYGFTNPNVVLWIQTDVWDNVYVIREYYRRGVTTPEMIAEINAEPTLGPLARIAKGLYPDPEAPGDATQQSMAWGVPLRSGTGGLILDRIDLIRRWLKIGPAYLRDGHDDRTPRLYFDHSCVNAVREMQDYRYPENKSELQNDNENPLKKDDHVPEALGRFMAGHYAQEVRKAGTATVHKARSA